MAAATETFRLSTRPCIGIVTVLVATSSSAGANPVDSGPRISAFGWVQSTSRYDTGPPASAHSELIECCWHHSTTSSKLAPRQIGSRNAEPIAPRSDLGEKGSLVFTVVMTPVTPAASAVRRIAPTLTGLLMVCSTTRNDRGFKLAS